MELEKLKQLKIQLDEQKKNVEDLQNEISTFRKAFEDEKRLEGIEDIHRRYQEENEAFDAEIRTLEAKLEEISRAENKANCPMDMAGLIRSFAEIALKELIIEKTAKAESLQLTKKIQDCNREARKCSQKLHSLQVTLIKLHQSEPQASKKFGVEMEGMRDIFARLTFLKELIAKKSDKEDAATLVKVIQDCSEEFRICCRKIQSIRRNVLKRNQNDRQNSGTEQIPA